MTKNLLSRFKNDESGATAIEYGLIAGALAIVIIAAMALMGPQIKSTFGKINTALATPITPQ